jgi:acetyl-CoA carboxylase biotin carboxyl carrier protein
MTDAECLEAVRRLLHLVDAHGLTELVVEEGGLKVSICGEERTEAVALDPAIFPDAGRLPPEAGDGRESHFHVIRSPMTGVFYRAAGPDVPPFVEPGDLVEEGQAVGLIEAMKLFSEIPADLSGRVVEIVAENGKLVSQDDPLILLDPEG